MSIASPPVCVISTCSLIVSGGSYRMVVIAVMPGGGGVPADWSASGRYTTVPPALQTNPPGVIAARRRAKSAA